jgi:hypothetical protein
MEFHRQMVLASRLTDGRAVFLAPDGGWVEDIRRGALAASPGEAEQLLARARTDEAANRVVEPYLIAVRDQDGDRRPVEWREVIRAAGPTVRTDLPPSRPS